MADSRRGEIGWYSPDPRAILPLDKFHASHSLRRRVRQGPYQITTDRAFRQVMQQCAGPRGRDRETWINDEIIESYDQLHQLGYAHSIEAWEIPQESKDADSTQQQERQGSGNAKLLGGLYGVALGGAFFGESMFSRATDASKVCLAHLIEHLRHRGYALLDVQFTSAHMSQFGVVEIPRDQYLPRLRKAITMTVDWGELDEGKGLHTS